MTKTYTMRLLSYLSFSCVACMRAEVVRMNYKLKQKAPSVWSCEVHALGREPEELAVISKHEGEWVLATTRDHLSVTCVSRFAAWQLFLDSVGASKT